MNEVFWRIIVFLFATSWAASPIAAGEVRDDRLYIIRSNDKYGFIDRQGQIVVQPRYDDFAAYGSTTATCDDDIHRRSFSQGLRPVKLGDQWGYIDKDEKFVIAPKFDMAGPFRDGRAEVLVGEKWGLIDRKGKVISEPRYSYISTFHRGWAPVAVAGERLEGGLPRSKWGLLDIDGNVILEPKYDMVYLWNNELALVNAGGKWGGSYGESFVGGKWGFVDRQGMFLSKPSISLPTRLELFSPRDDEQEELPISLLFAHGLCPVAVDGKWGYIDERGRIAIKSQFDWAGPFAIPPDPATYWEPEFHDYGRAVRMKAGKTVPLARAQVNGKFGFIDRSGAWVVKPAHDRIGHFSEGLAWVKNGERFAFVNERGVELFRVEKGEEGREFWHGIAAVRVGDLWGIVDTSGRWIHEPQFDEIDSFTDSLQVVVKDKKRGLIDGKGRIVCPVQYDWIHEPGNSGLALVVKGDVYSVDSEKGLVDKTGRFLLEPVFGRDFSTVNEKGQSNQKIFPRQKEGLWGFTDRTGKFVIEPRYDRVEWLGEGMIGVWTLRWTGLVNVRSGKIVCGQDYEWIDRFSEGLARFRILDNGNIGFLDRSGKVVIPPTWKVVSSFNNGVAAVTVRTSAKSSYFSWVDRNGKYLWSPSKK